MKILVLLVVMVFSLANSGLSGEADWRRKVNGKPPDPLQRLHDTARLLRARVFTPLGRAAASRPEGGERHHGGRIFHRRLAMSRASLPITSGRLSTSRREPRPLLSARANRRASFRPCWRRRHATDCLAIPHYRCRES